MNNKAFFNNIRKDIFGGKLTQIHVDNINIILDECKRVNICDNRFIAYILATTYHETAHTMQPIEEYGKGKGRSYGSKIKMSKKIYTTPNKIYYGRGYVQLTWYENYELMGRLLGIDLLNNPELALKSDVAAKIIVEGMTKGSSSFGDFTGKSLEHYFTDDKTDWVNARRIVNGTDKADLIASYAIKFYNALIAV